MLGCFSGWLGFGVFTAIAFIPASIVVVAALLTLPVIRIRNIPFPAILL